jgi:hypothetical protein
VDRRNPTMPSEQTDNLDDILQELKDILTDQPMYLDDGLAEKTRERDDNAIAEARAAIVRMINEARIDELTELRKQLVARENTHE